MICLMYATCEIAMNDAVAKDGTAASAPTVIVSRVKAPGPSDPAVCAPLRLTWNCPDAIRVGWPEATTLLVAGFNTMNCELTESYAAPWSVLVMLKVTASPVMIRLGPDRAVAGTFGTIKLSQWSAKYG